VQNRLYCRLITAWQNDKNIVLACATKPRCRSAAYSLHILFDRSFISLMQYVCGVAVWLHPAEGTMRIIGRMLNSNDYTVDYMTNSLVLI